ncbi:MAG TPA: TolC family protein [Gemmatimonadota bacterium]|nr:TolC family protein [Gemmatimonadota bacterium]
MRVLTIGLAILAWTILQPAAAMSQQTAAGEQRAEISLSVADAVERALESNEEARIARAQVDRTRGQVKEVFADALPSVDGSYRLVRNLQRPVIFFNQGGVTQQISIGEQNEHAFVLSVEQPIFDRRLGAAVSAARHGEAASEAIYARALSDVALRTREAYYEVLRSRAVVEARRGAVQLAGERLQQVELFLDVGTASEFDQLTARVDLENERPALIRAENALNLSINALKRVTGIPLEAEVALTDSLAFDPVTLELEQAVARALDRRDDLEAQARTVELSEELVNVARAEAYPSLSLQLDLARRSSSEDFVPEDRDFSQSTSAALSLDIPIFDGRRTQGQALRARADHVAAIERYRALERDVQLGVLDAWQSVQAADRAVEATRATEEQARRAYEIARVRFRNGLSTQLELDEAEQSVVEAQLNAAQALFDHMVARARLLNATGER